MKKIFARILVLALFLSLCLSSCALFTSNTEPESTETEGFDGISFSSFSATDLNGKAVNESVLKEKKLTMINIWATFCGPCISEMPSLGRLSTAYGDAFQIIGIPTDVVDFNARPVDSQIEEAIEIVEETGADYLHLIPGEDLQRIHISQVQAVPETFFVDEKGNQVGDIYIGARSEAEWSVIIETLLEEVK